MLEPRQHSLAAAGERARARGGAEESFGGVKVSHVSFELSFINLQPTAAAAAPPPTP
jgi:hypothetical protein